ncbi:MAG: DUF1552 domain-containing protein [Myxococcota bacterium]
MSRSQRREFLKAASAVGLLPFLPSRFASAQGNPPRNLLLVFHPNGLERGWEPSTPGALELSDVLMPFSGLEEKMVVFGGIKSGIRNEPLAHPEGMTSLFTGTPGNGDETVATGSSLDQRVAERWAAGSPFSSIELGVQSLDRPVSNTNILSYDRLAQPRPPEDDPTAAFNRIFGSGDDAAQRAELRARRESVLDFAGQSVARVRDLYGAEADQQLEAHLTAIRSVEQRLGSLEGLAACGREGRENVDLARLLYDTSIFTDLVDLQSDLAVRALACGASRVLSLQLSNSSSNTRISGVNDSIGLHQVMHERTPAEKRAINAYFVQKVADLVTRLEETPGQGEGTLLDETLVIWGTEMSIGNHGNHPVPFFFFGASETLKGGQYLAYGDEGRPRHTRLLETAAPLLGLESLGRFGNWSDEESTGVIEEVLR